MTDTTTSAPTSAGPGAAAEDPGLAALTAVLAQLSAHAADPGPAGRAARIDRIAVLERMRAAVAAAQNAEIVAFGRAEAEHQAAAPGFDPGAVGRGIADQIALAARVSPTAGSRRLGTARDLHHDLPATAALLARGEISEHLARHVVSAVDHLGPATRREVDARLAGAGLAHLGPRRAAALATRFAYEADPAAAVQRTTHARTERRVGLRPAPGSMTWLTALLPVEQGVACLAALRRHADTAVAAGEPRTRGQVMADTLVERVTGQARATDVDVEVGVLIGVDALLDPGTDATAEILGHGPLPARLARRILADTGGRRFLRRLFTRPAGGPLIGGDPRRRCFDGVLNKIIRIRDGDLCRDPFCDAPARHIDHIRPARDDGPATYTNGRAVCVRGNQVRELPGWTVELVDDGLGDRPHTVRTTTPTGHVYSSRAGP